MLEMVNNKRIRKLYSDGFISDKTLDYLSIKTKPKAGRFHLLPKINKKGCPEMLVISACGTCTEKIWSQKYHLTLKIPNTFYRCLMGWEDCQREQFW